MTRALEERELRAELAAIESMLADLPESYVFERAGLEGRAQQIRSKIAVRQLGTIARHAQVALYFGGDPVVGSVGVDASFGGAAIERFQSLVDAVRHGSAPQQEKPGPPGRGLHVTATLHGSFGFQLEEMDRPLLETSGLAVAVDTTLEVVEAAKAPDEVALDALIGLTGAKVHGKLRTFFSHLAGHGAAMRLVGDYRRVDFDRSETASVATRLSAAEVTEDTETIEGTFGGELSFVRKFDLKTADKGLIISGLIPKTVAADKFDIWQHKRCRAVLTVTTKTVSGQQRRTYTLQDILPPLESGTEPLPE